MAKLLLSVVGYGVAIQIKAIKGTLMQIWKSHYIIVPYKSNTLKISYY